MYNRRTLRSYYTWDALFRKQNYTAAQQTVAETPVNETTGLLDDSHTEGKLAL